MGNSPGSELSRARQTTCHSGFPYSQESGTQWPLRSWEPGSHMDSGLTETGPETDTPSPQMLYYKVPLGL